MRKIIIAVLALISMVAIMLMYGYTPIMLHAETFDSYVDYSEYLVSDFNDYDTVVKVGTPGVSYYLSASGSMLYKTSYCPGDGIIATLNVIWQLEVNGSYVDFATSPIVNMPCLAPNKYYTYSASVPMNTLPDIGSKLLGDDNEYIRVNAYIQVRPRPASYGYSLTIDDYTSKHWLEMRFDTTYLMSTFLLDSDFEGSFMSSANSIHRPFVLYAETYADRYNVYNDNLTQSLTARHKYAVAIPELDTAIAVNKIGTGWETKQIDPYSETMSSASIYYQNAWRIYMLNAAPMKTPYDNVAVDTTPNYAICDTALFGWPVDCVLNGENIGSFEALGNNLLEWLIKESPLFSDIYTVAAGGFQWFGNALQFLGSFGSVGVFGGMITLSAGVLLIVWGFKGE